MLVWTWPRQGVSLFYEYNEIRPMISCSAFRIPIPVYNISTGPAGWFPLLWSISSGVASFSGVVFFLNKPTASIQRIKSHKFILQTTSLQNSLIRLNTMILWKWLHHREFVLKYCFSS